MLFFFVLRYCKVKQYICVWVAETVAFLVCMVFGFND